MNDWVFGYAVYAVGLGYVRDVDAREGSVEFCQDWVDCLVCKTARDAVLVQHWVLNVLGDELPGGGSVQVGTCPLLLALPGEV